RRRCVRDETPLHRRSVGWAPRPVAPRSSLLTNDVERFGDDPDRHAAQRATCERTELRAGRGQILDGGTVLPVAIAQQRNARPLTKRRYDSESSWQERCGGPGAPWLSCFSASRSRAARAARTSCL